MNDYDPTSPSPAGSAPATAAVQTRRPGVRRLLSKKRSGWIVGAGLTCAVAGLTGTSAAADFSSSAPSLSAADTSSPAPSPSLPAGGGSRSAPAAGGATGIV